MNDFFRKHGKWLLGILGVVLMFLWMMPNKSNMGNEGASSREMGRLNGKKITYAELNGSNNDITLIETFGPLMANRIGNTVWQDFLQRLNSSQRQLHLYLLLQEAQQNHLSATPDEIAGFIRNMGLSDLEVKSTLQRLRLDDDALLRQAVADYLSVQKLDNLAYAALRPSLPEMKHISADMSNKISVNYVRLDATQNLLAASTPSDAEIKEQYETYKNSLAASFLNPDPELVHGHKYPFGYKFPDRVQVEYLFFDHAMVKTALVATMTPKQESTDYLEAKRYYDDHPTEFVDRNAVGATQPAPVPFASVVALIKDRILEQRVENLLNQMTEEARKKAAEPWKGTSEDGYRIAIPREKWASYEAVADAISKDGRFKKYKPSVVKTSGLMGKSQLFSLQNIGQAYYVAPRRNPLFFPMIATSVKELITEKPKDPILQQMQVGVEGQVLADSNNNKYLFRVINAEKSRNPTSLEEVRDQVAVDVIRKHNYEKYLAQGQKLAQEAAVSGLAAVAEKGKLRLEREDNYVRVRLNDYVPVLQPSPVESLKAVIPEFSQAAFDLSVQAGKPTLGEVAATATTQAATAPANVTEVIYPAPGNTKKPVSTFGVESRLEVYVMELANLQPIAIDDFGKVGTRKDVSQQAMREMMRSFLRRWDSLEELSKRVGYVSDNPLKNTDE